MSPLDTLKEKIASMLDVPVDSITDSTSLSRLRSSAMRAVLGSQIRACFGKTVDTSQISTMGELSAVLSGGDIPAAPSPAAAAAPGPAQAAAPSLGVELGAGIQVGVDMEHISAMPVVQSYWTDAFYTDHFSPEELAYCTSQDEPREHLLVRWCAKEALRKTGEEYVSALFSDLQVVRLETGQPQLQHRASADASWSPLPLSVSLSHAGQMGIAVVAAPLRAAQEVESAPAADDSVPRDPPPAAEPEAPPHRSFFRRLFGS